MPFFPPQLAFASLEAVFRTSAAFDDRLRLTYLLTTAPMCAAVCDMKPISQRLEGVRR